MSVTHADPKYCTVCGSRIAEDVFQAQRAEGFGEGADCRDCLESVPDNPQMQSLFESIRESLDGDKRDVWDDAEQEDKVLLAMDLINKGIATGGTLGFTEQLRKYACIMQLDG